LKNVAPHEAPPPNDALRERFAPFDYALALGAIAGALGLFAFPIMGSSFAAMFRDFGNAQLPALTQLVITGWFPPILGLLVAGATARGLRGAMPLVQRRLWILGAMVLAGVSIGVCVVGVYLPIFTLAGNIK